MAKKIKSKVTKTGRSTKISLLFFVVIFAGVGAYFIINSLAATVPGMYLTPATANVNGSTTFTVDVMEDSGTTLVNAVQANLTYNSTLLNVTSVDAASGAFKTVVQAAGSNGSISIAAGVQPPPDTCDANGCTPNPVVPISGLKKVATITFTSKTTAGAAAVTFVSGTQILQASDNSNILGAINSTNTPGGTYTVVIPDTTAPTAPSGLSAVVNSTNPTTSVNLSWTASTDAVGVTGYNIYRNGATTPTATTTGTGTTFTNTGLTPSTAYTYTVKAKDAAGNVSAASNTANVTTQAAADIIKPSVSITAPTAGANVSGTTTITATASDNVGVVGVKFYLDPSTTNGLIGSEDTSSPYSASWNTTTLSNGSHQITAIARDAAGNTQTASTVTVNVSNAPAVDTTPPSVPSGLGSSGITTTSFTLNWNASTDSGTNGSAVAGVANYQIFRSSSANGTFTSVGSSNTTSSNQSGLTASTTYFYKVAAVDTLGNTSAQSSALSVTTASVPKPPLAGDTNGDHTVNISDLAILLQNWQKNYPAADFNNTGGVVDIGDLSILLSNFSKSN
jgi:chitodextrinase